MQKTKKIIQRQNLSFILSIFYANQKLNNQVLRQSNCQQSQQASQNNMKIEEINNENMYFYSLSNLVFTLLQIQQQSNGCQLYQISEYKHRSIYSKFEPKQKTTNMKKKFNLSIDCEEISEMEQSIFSEIGKDGLRFLREDIHVGPQGMTTMSGQDIDKLLKINKDSVSLINRQLGKGASGTVQEGIYLPQNISVAIKTINVYDRDKRHQIMNDIKILLKNIIREENSGYTCNFIVNLYGAYFDQGAVKVILELMDAGSLDNIINIYKIAKVQPNIPEPVLAKIALQILCGISFLHSHRLVHRDIKPANILLNSKGQVKVTDFGISKEFVEDEFSKTFVGTRAYMSPQRIQGDQYDYKGDIWGFGLIIFELSTGRHPYANKSFIEMQQAFLNQKSPQLPQDFSSELRDFISRCLQTNPKLRADFLQLIGHPWIIKNISKKADINGWFQQIQNEILPKIKK